MSWSIKLFRVQGIDVKVHLTFVLILVWAGYGWASAGGSGLAGAIFGVVAIILLFGCITLHELGHSFQALAYGVRVRQILLLPIGGVADMEEIPDKPGQELRIALAGPLVSFALAAVFFGLAALLGGGVGVEPVDLAVPGRAGLHGMLAYLSTANLFLGLFNLIPAFPMDGGRILRAALALRLDYRRATAIAVAIGQGLAMVLGLLGFVSGSFFTVLIAIFIWIGAGQEGGLVEVRDTLRDVRVGGAMTRRPEVLLAGDTLERAVDLTLSTAQADFPVLDEARRTVVGLLTRDDLIKGLRHHGAGTPVRQVMRETFPSTTPDAPLFEAQRQMLGAGVHALPVLGRDGSLVGLLTLVDVNEAFSLSVVRQAARKLPA